MVSVHTKKQPEEQVTFGELLSENNKEFRVHSSSALFSKKEYEYKKII